MPRTAVSKFIELCDICSMHRQRGGSGVLQPAQEEELGSFTDGGKTRRSREARPRASNSSQTATAILGVLLSKATESSTESCISESAESPLIAPSASNKENVLTA